MKIQLLACGLLLLATPAVAAKKMVAMKSISFDPKVISIRAGDEVEWANQSYTEHSATADAEAGFDTGTVAPKKSSKSIVFKNPGDFPYHCRVHGKTMSGLIKVGAQP